MLFFSLPLGLSAASKLYVLQRASHAKKWKGLITETGILIFTGLTIVVALEDSEGEKKWSVQSIHLLQLSFLSVLSFR